MTSGTIVLNGVTDKQLAKIMEFKVSHEAQFSFALNQAQPVQLPQNQPAITNNIILAWQNDLSS